MKQIKLFTFFLFVTFLSYSQNDDASFWNNAMKQITRYQSQEGWVELNENTSFSHAEFFPLNREAFQITNDDEMVLLKEIVDFIGQKHYLYQQYYKGLEVEGGRYLLHQEDNNRIYLANGQFIRNINLNTQPQISKENAFFIAKASVNATTYSWEVPNTSLFYLPKDTGQLLIFNLPISDSSTITTPRLAYKFRISAFEPNVDYYVYVEANTGETLSSLTLNYQANCHSGTAVTLYNGERTITTRKIGQYRLRDMCRGGSIQTGIEDFIVKDADNYWSDPDKIPAASAHWASEMTYDYFYYNFNRNSYDGNGKKISNLTMMPIPSGGSPVAWYRPAFERFEFFKPDNIKYNNHPVSLDAVGHEYTHGVIYHSSNLTYRGESGALNESFADIFGNMVKFYVIGNASNYLMGENFWIKDGKARDLANPNSKQHPHTYQGNYWLTPITAPNEDDTTMHYNAGVQSYWFYLLANGGTGVNDHGYAYSVQGIGRNKAAEIAYLNLTAFLTSGSNYADAAMGAINAAKYLFGNCSNEMIQTYKAWKAVGVPINIVNISEYNLAPSCSFINNPPYPFNLLPTRTFVAVNNITSNCSITTTKPVIFKAGNEINLLPGFYSGNDFHAFIIPCSFPNNARSLIVTTQDFEDDEIYVEQDTQFNFFNNFTPDIKLIPNPTSQSFSIEPNFNSEDIRNVQVFNLFGQIIYQTQTYNNERITLPPHCKGAFIVKVATEKEVLVKKVIVL